MPDRAEGEVEVWHEHGQVCAYGYPAHGQNWLHVPGLATFRFLRADQPVVGIPIGSADRVSVRDAFERTALPMALQSLGRQVLHASGVRGPTGVIAFCGESGTGKSTLAYAAGRRGNELWADDAVAFEVDGHGVAAIPLPFRVLLRPESSAFFGADASAEAQRPAAADRERLAAVVILERTRATKASPSRACRVQTRFGQRSHRATATGRRIRTRTRAWSTTTSSWRSACPFSLRASSLASSRSRGSSTRSRRSWRRASETGRPSRCGAPGLISTPADAALLARMLAWWIALPLLKRTTPLPRLVRFAQLDPRRTARDPEREEKVAALAEWLFKARPRRHSRQLPGAIARHLPFPRTAQRRTRSSSSDSASRRTATVGHVWVTVDGRPVHDQQESLDAVRSGRRLHERRQTLRTARASRGLRLNFSARASA